MQNEYMYAGDFMLDSARRYVLTWKPAGDYVDSRDTKSQWFITPVSGHPGKYHIQNVASSEYMFAGYFSLDSERRYVLTYTPRKGWVTSEHTYMWKIDNLP